MQASNVKRGTKFYRADLHIHTPASRCYQDFSVKPEQIVQEALNKNLDIIAITDHNTVSNCYEIIEKAKGTNLVVLPGVEITALGGKGGLHILAIFDCTTRQEKIHDMLVRIGIDSDKHGKVDAITSEPIQTVFDEIVKAGGVVIAAHVDETSGLVSDCRGQPRITYLQDTNLTALEYVKPDTPLFFDGKDPNYPRRLPCIQSSDAHSLADIGRRLTHLKMDKPCIEGLRQSFLDPDSRIRPEHENNLPTYPQIVSVAVNGGFLDGQVLEFNPNLTCLIGGRGSGKTTTIELIRFCLGFPSKVPEIADRSNAMVKGVLGEGEVSVILKTKYGTTYKVQRKVSQEEPFVYDITGTRHNLLPSALIPLLCYGEGEIEHISFEPSSQLALVDKYIPESHKFFDEERQILDSLVQNSTAIMTLRDRIIQLDSQYSELNSINVKLVELEKHNFGKEIEQKKQRADELVLLQKITNASNSLLQQLCATIATKEASQVADELPPKEDITKLPNSDIVEKALSDFNEIRTHFNKSIESEKVFLETKKRMIEQSAKDLAGRHQEQEKIVVELFKQLEAKGDGEAARNYLELQKKRTELQAVPGQINAAKNEIGNLEKNREALLINLGDVRSKHSKARQECSKSLSSRLGGNICVEVIAEGDKTSYAETLALYLKQSRVQKTDIQKIVETLHPFDFFNVILRKDKETLMKVGLSDRYSEIIVNYSSLIDNIYQIQEVTLPDLAVITLEVGGKKKTLDTVSLGQKCTTLLSLIMLDSEAPLILDTPEEGLDNMFVFSNVVKTLRDIKEKRQVIIATHNANIPVSGDAELIVGLDSDGSHGKTVCQGSIDDCEMKEKVQEVLEGGKVAFVLRQRKYGY